jgi:transposase
VTGLPGEENRGLAEDLALLPQLPILPAQPAQLITLDAGEAIATATCVQISLANPLTNSGLGQVQLPGDLADRLAAASDQLDDFSLVLRREEPSGAWHRTPISRAEPSSWVSTKPGQLQAGIDAHKHTFTVAVLDGRGGRCGIESFPTSPDGLADMLALLDSFGFAIGRIGVEGSAGLGRHITQALVAAGYDVREVQANRTAERRRRRRRHKTDREDAEAIARETLADAGLPPAGKQRRPDPCWDELVAVRNRRKSLINQRVRLLNEAEAVLTSLPLTIRAVLPPTSRVRPRLRALDRGAASSIQVTAADRVNLAWLVEAAGDIARLDARVTELDHKIPALLGRLGCTLTDEYGIAAVGAMELLVEVGDPTRFATEAQFARWCGAAPVAVSSGEGDQAPTHHRLDLAGNRQVNSTLHLMHVTQVRSYPPARDDIAKKRAEHKTKREARRAHKRHLANVVIRRMWADHTQRFETVADQATPAAA